jgi:hypothetical protein
LGVPINKLKQVLSSAETGYYYSGNWTLFVVTVLRNLTEKFSLHYHHHHHHHHRRRRHRDHEL